MYDGEPCVTYIYLFNIVDDIHTNLDKCFSINK